MTAGINEPDFTVSHDGGIVFLTLVSKDGMNCLTRRRVVALKEEILGFCSAGAPVLPLVLSGNPNFSAGADLHEIPQLNGPDALAFAAMGQALMTAVENFPAPTFAAISGYCMGGGLDLALACRYRIAAPHSVFGHRGAALGLVTGWGGTQRLPRLIGKGRALEMFVAAEKVSAPEALAIGLIDAVADDPVVEAIRRLQHRLQDL
jgi:enoyl-CoA hydratase/carnithine racemase